MMMVAVVVMMMNSIIIKIKKTTRKTPQLNAFKLLMMNTNLHHVLVTDINVVDEEISEKHIHSRIHR